MPQCRLVCLPSKEYSVGITAHWLLAPFEMSKREVPDTQVHITLALLAEAKVTSMLSSDPSKVTCSRHWQLSKERTLGSRVPWLLTMSPNCPPGATPNMAVSPRLEWFVAFILKLVMFAKWKTALGR